MSDYYPWSAAAKYRDGVLCRCGHNACGHLQGPSTRCLGYSMSGGACGMEQQCGCVAFTKRQEASS